MSINATENDMGLSPHQRLAAATNSLRIAAEAGISEAQDMLDGPTLRARVVNLEEALLNVENVTIQDHPAYTIAHNALKR